MNNRMMIWGTGKYGSMAYHLYKDEYQIVCFIDNNSDKWGEKFYNIPICSPDSVREENCIIIIAVKNDFQSIIDYIRENMKTQKTMLFSVQVESASEIIENGLNNCIIPDSVIVSFAGGLGNQMFQYALYRCLEKKRKKVYANLDSYKIDIKTRFMLKEVFGIDLDLCNTDEEISMLTQLHNNENHCERFVVFSESDESGTVKSAPMDLLDVDGGIIKGYFQTYQFAHLIKDELSRIFVFDKNRERKLAKLSDEIRTKNAVSVHFRLGDYLSKHNIGFYGGICTEKYYRGAIEYMLAQDKNVEFYVFTDDIKNVRKAFGDMIPCATYIDSNMFDEYEDWYDMYLMSMCRHNIIANSTFSWWGAWLNPHDDKTVIAPTKWINKFEYTDIYPDTWVRIDG